MPGTAIAKRYAQAIASIAKEQGSWDEWAQDMHLLANLAADHGFRQLMESPKVAQSQKLSFVDEHLAQVSLLARQLTKLLVMKHRVELLPDLADAFQLLLDEQRGVEHVLVTTAIPLEVADQATLKQRLEAYTGKQVSVAMEVDPSIIGGVVIRIGDKVIDGSTQGRLEGLRRQLTGAY